MSALKQKPSDVTANLLVPSDATRKPPASVEHGWLVWKTNQASNFLLQLMYRLFVAPRSPMVLSWIETAALCLLLIVRCTVAFFALSAIGSAGTGDVVFEYWEPVHYLVRGSGFQSPRYDPRLPLRPWLPAYLLCAPLRFAAFVGLLPLTDGPQVLRVVCLMLALFSFVCDTIFAHALRRSLGPLVGLYWVLFHTAVVAASGLRGVGSAVAPQQPPVLFGSIALLAWACFLHGQVRAAACIATVTVTVVWPPAALSFLPPVLQVIGSQHYETYRSTAMTAALLCLLSMVLVILVDRCFYGRWTMTQLNQALYSLGLLRSRFVWKLPQPSCLCYLRELVLNLHFLLLLAADSVSSMNSLSQGVGAAGVLLLAIPIWILPLLAAPYKDVCYLHVIFPQLCTAAAISAHRLHLRNRWPHPRYMEVPDTRKLLRILFARAVLNRRQRFRLYGLLLFIFSAYIARARGVMESIPIFLAISPQADGRPVKVWEAIPSTTNGLPCNKVGAATATNDSAVCAVGDVCHGGSQGEGGCLVCAVEWRSFAGSFFLPPEAQLAFVSSAQSPGAPHPPPSFSSGLQAAPHVDPGMCNLVVDYWEAAQRPTEAPERLLRWQPAVRLRGSDAQDDLPVRPAICEAMGKTAAGSRWLCLAVRELLPT